MLDRVQVFSFGLPCSDTSSTMKPTSMSALAAGSKVNHIGCPRPRTSPKTLETISLRNTRAAQAHAFDASNGRKRQWTDLRNEKQPPRRPNQKRCGNDCGNLTTNRLQTSIKPIDLAEAVSPLHLAFIGVSEVYILNNIIYNHQNRNVSRVNFENVKLPD